MVYYRSDFEWSTLLMAVGTSIVVGGIAIALVVRSARLQPAEVLGEVTE